MLCILNYYTYLCIVVKRITTLIIQNMSENAAITVKIILLLSKMQEKKELFKKGLMNEKEFEEELSLTEVRFKELNDKIENKPEFVRSMGKKRSKTKSFSKR